MSNVILLQIFLFVDSEKAAPNIYQCCNYMCVHRFRFNEAFVLAGNDVMAFSVMRLMQVIYHCGF